MVEVLGLSTAGWVAGGVVFLCIWATLAFWPARVARCKGHSFLGYFLLGLLFFPFALLAAHMVHDRTGVAAAA